MICYKRDWNQVSREKKQTDWGLGEERRNTKKQTMVGGVCVALFSCLHSASRVATVKLKKGKTFKNGK